MVQGVGFRPFVYNLARKFKLTGFVFNHSDGVTIEVEGEPTIIDEFIHCLQSEMPPLAEIDSLTSSDISMQGDMAFTIKESESYSAKQTLISPDMGICDECLKELFDPNNRRFGYPFINCTNCGPRFTIIKDTPYDRPLTTMAGFTMCAECQAEYDEPTNRRFHAQPNACAKCGPKVWLTDNTGKMPDQTGSLISQAAELLARGKILAVKGLGGYHLMVNAHDSIAVQRLRQRKHREEKALAVMAPNLATAKTLVELDDVAESWLKSQQAPIVLAAKKVGNNLAAEVAPNNPQLGVMLPYTPLHHLLLQAFGKATEGRHTALVATSANLTDEPIAIDNDDAQDRLAQIADIFLMHNRDILIRADDSVLTTLNGTTLMLRRSRGFVPKPITLGKYLRGNLPTVLAVGPELKNTICINRDKQFFLSQHIGDLENLLAYNGFKESIAHLQSLLDSKPEIIAHDLHPGYFSTQWALEQDLPKVAVQHHHAHMAAVMGEHELAGPCVGIMLDGTGYGTDGAIWGGEFLYGDMRSFERAGHFEYMPLPGGDAAIKQPWRTAAAYVYAATKDRELVATLFPGRDTASVIMMVERNMNTVQTSSAGRLFDAAAALGGAAAEAHYEAQAAIELTNAYQSVTSKIPVFVPRKEAGRWVIPVSDMMVHFAFVAMQKTALSLYSGIFHKALAEVIAATAIEIAKDKSCKKIVLGGGVFQNRVLLQLVLAYLDEAGMESFFPHKVPINDGGVSLGQALIALHQHQ
jgi:hydrogenase maturation protein HypF